MTFALAYRHRECLLIAWSIFTSSLASPSNLLRCSFSFLAFCIWNVVAMTFICHFMYPEGPLFRFWFAMILYTHTHHMCICLCGTFRHFPICSLRVYCFESNRMESNSMWQIRRRTLIAHHFFRVPFLLFILSFLSFNTATMISLFVWLCFLWTFDFWTGFGHFVLFWFDLICFGVVLTTNKIIFIHIYILGP